jgi:23S rRNA pseudouridine1911/1915/1917 synthase
VLRRFQVGAPSSGTRLDLFLVAACSDLSRSRIQKLIAEGAARVGGEPAKRSHVVRAGQQVSVEVPEPRESVLEAEDIPLSILYEDEDLIAIDKPAGLVVHPAPGHSSGTLVNAGASAGPASCTGSTATPRACFSWPRPTGRTSCSPGRFASAP